MESLAGIPQRYCGDDGSLPVLSSSGRIYEAEKDLAEG